MALELEAPSASTQVHRPPHCENCPYKTSRTVGSHGPRDAPVVLLGEAPGPDELVSGKPFIGPSGNLIRPAIKAVGIEDVLMVNSMSCRPPKGTLPERMMPAILACRQRVLAELASSPRKVVIAAGNSALRSITARKAVKITQERGKAFHIDELGGAWIVPTIHPAAILRRGSSPDEFRALKSDLAYAAELAAEGTPIRRSPGITKYFVADTPAKAQAAVAGLLKKKYLAADIETGGGGKVQLNPRKAILLSMAVSWEKNRAVVFPGEVIRQNLPMFRRLFDTEGPTWIWHNGKFDTAVLRDKRLRLKAEVMRDTMLSHYSLQETGVHDLETISGEYLGAHDYKEMLDPYIESREDDFAKIPREILYRYNAYDSDNTWQLEVNEFEPKLRKSPAWQSYTKVLIPAANFLREVEGRGLPVGIEELDQLDAQLTAEMHAAKSELVGTIGSLWNAERYAREFGAKKVPKAFNPGSWQHVHWLLYTRMALRPRKGFPLNTEETTLLTLPPNPVVGALLKYRGASHAKSTNVDGIRDRLEYHPEHHHEVEGACYLDFRIHSTLQLHRTATGRLSSVNPNIQNIPAEERIKRIFRAPPGWKFVELDLSQAELRMLAYFSQDDFLRECFILGRKLHHEVAIEMYGEGYNHDQYMRAKAVNFGIAYGRGANSLATEFNISIQEAEEIISKWFARAPKAKAWLDKQRLLPLKGKPVVMPLGRIRRWGLVTKDNVHDLQNEACNTPIQSTTSDINLLTAAEVDQILIERWNSYILNLVHDSMLILVPDDGHTDLEVAAYVKKQLEAAPAKLLPDCDIPFLADVKTGYRWGELKEIHIAA